jgi:hypothetical protein
MNVCAKIVPCSIRPSVLLLVMVVAVLLLPPRWVGAAFFRGLGDFPGGNHDEKNGRVKKHMQRRIYRCV